MPKLTIDGIEIDVAPGTTILQAAETLGIEIPRFCYHERLSIAGNCRMCLVEVEKAPKPVASCAMPVGEGMVVRTSTANVLKARKGVMELILINHPLDCPICDQGGECDLQDQAVAYGRDRGRFAEIKNALKKKDFGPLVKAEMTRCITCTRCVRFTTEVAGVPDLGGIGRGEHLEIDTYVGKAIGTELSGCLIDLCPVGALTSAPYAFKARPWELKKTETIDCLDALGSNIRADSRGNEVLRVMPRNNDDINEEWLGDKSRFAVDGLMRGRLDRPYIRENGHLREASWTEALNLAASKLKSTPAAAMAAIAGDLADCESIAALKDLMTDLKVASLDCRQDFAQIDPSCRAGYLFNATIAGIEQADALLLIGANPRKEAPVLNARIRKRSLKSNFPVGVIGPKMDQIFKYEHLGDSAALIEDIASGKHPFAGVLKAAKKPMLILGMGALSRHDGSAILAAARKLAESCGMIADGWNGFSVLHTAAARVGALDLGFVPERGGRDVKGILDGASKGDVKLVYLLGADEIDVSRLGSAFVIYQGHHGDVGAARADIILPGAAYTEKNATYVNTEGRVQQAKLAVFPPGQAREDWRIIRALADVIGIHMPYDNLSQMRARLCDINPLFAKQDVVTPAAWGAFGTPGPVADEPLKTAVANYYMTDAIGRASPTMAVCVETFVSGAKPRTGTHG
ncbi:NADH-quinone oxidoreductase subunit G [Rhodospirillaceae bacterium LM-1]|nr:NADH-quinone oxidoreductase subunit G [Rhodospirillaceae bacterium LM-1]